MGFPMAEAYLFCEISTESLEVTQMTPSSLFAIASFGGLFACVVLCLICSECYSRYRNRRAYHGITQSSSGEHQLPTTVPSSHRNLPSKACDIPAPPLSSDELERELDRRALLHEKQFRSRFPYRSIVSYMIAGYPIRRELSHGQLITELDRREMSLHQPQSRRTSESTIRRSPSHDQLISELDRRAMSLHQPRRRRTSESTIRRHQSHDQLVSELNHRAMSLHQPQSLRTNGSAVRTKPTRSTSFEVVIEPGRQSTPYPHESVRQEIQVEDPEPTISSGNQYLVRVIDTPPSLFERVAKESAQYGLPTPMPNCQTMPQIYKTVRRKIQEEDSEPIPSHRSPQSAAQATPTHSPPVDQAVRESDSRETLQVHRSESDRTHQSIVKAVPTRSPLFEQVIQPPREATPYVHQSERQAVQPASSAVQPASSAVQPASSLEADFILAQILDQNEDSSLDYDRYSVLSNSGECESFEDPYLRRMYALERGFGNTPPPEYLSALWTPPPSYSDVMMRGPSESPPIQYSPTWARYRPAFLRVESPPSTPSAHNSEEDPLQCHMSTSSKSNEAEDKTDIESSTEAKGAVGGTLSKSTKPETKGAMVRTKSEEALLQAKIAATWAMMKEDIPKMTDETTEVERAIPEMKDAASRTEGELPMPKMESAMSSSESKYALPKTKGRPAPAGIETEWFYSKPRGATSRTEEEWGMPKTDDAVASTEKELSMPKKSSRTRSYRELVTLKTKSATGTTDPDWVFQKSEGATARIETEWPFLETEGAVMRSEAEDTIAKSSDRKFRDPTESSYSTGDIDSVPISTDFYASGGARPKVLTKSGKKKSKSKRKNEKK